MFIKLKSGTMLNLFYLQDAFRGKHDKSIVIFYLINGVKLIEEYNSEDDALARVDEVHTIMTSTGIGGGGTSSISGDAKLEKTIISNVVLGATNAGTEFPKDMTFTEFAEKILRKSITPTISTSFTGNELNEVGSTISGATMTLKITNLSSVTVPINEVKFYVGSTCVDTQSFVTGQNIYTYDYTTAITTNTSVKAELTYNTTQKVSGTKTYSFIYPVFYGVTILSTVTDADANSFMTDSFFTKELRNTKSLTWNNIDLDDERFCYMYPKSLGALTSIKDGNGFNQSDGYTRFECNLVIAGNTVPYYVYLLTDETIGEGFTQIYS